VAGYTPRWLPARVPQMVTHPSTNQARRSVTTLIETNVLSLARRTSSSVKASSYGYELIARRQRSRCWCWCWWCIGEQRSLGDDLTASCSLLLTLLQSYMRFTDSDTGSTPVSRPDLPNKITRYTVTDCSSYCKSTAQHIRGVYRSGSPTAVQAWRPCPLWEPSPSHGSRPIL